MIDKIKLYNCKDDDFEKLLNFIDISSLRNFFLDKASQLPSTNQFYRSKNGSKKGRAWDSLKGIRDNNKPFSFFKKFYFDYIKNYNSNPNFLDDFNKLLLRELGVKENDNEMLKEAILVLDEDIKKILLDIFNITISESELKILKIKNDHLLEIDEINKMHISEIENLKIDFEKKMIDRINELTKIFEKEKRTEVEENTIKIKKESAALIDSYILKNNELQKENSNFQKNILNLEEKIKSLEKNSNDSFYKKIVEQLDIIDKDEIIESISKSTIENSNLISKKLIENFENMIILLRNNELTNFDKKIVSQFILFKIMEGKNG